MTYDEFTRQYSDSTTDQTLVEQDNSVSEELDSLQWAKQAYARLKEKQ